MNAEQKSAQRDLHKTTALCPQCLRELPARVYADGEGEGEGVASGVASEGAAASAAETNGGGVVWMERTCPEHGTVTTRMWNNAEHYEWIRAHGFPKVAPPFTNKEAAGPCPFSCGTCTRHERRGTLLEIEVTRNCNLHCPVCFMGASTGDDDPTLEEIGAMYDTIAAAVGTNGAVQLTGGEPTTRADLAEIILMGREKGFWGIELNTNGLVIASRPGYLEGLVAAGLTGVFLSFDGLTGEVYEGTCGRDILDVKLRAVQRCRECRIQVVLSVAVVAGLNDHQLGDILRFAMENADVVAGIALQPAFTSGRFDVDRIYSMSSGDVIFAMAEQSEGLLDVYDFWPLGTSHPLCDTGVFLLHDPQGEAVRELQGEAVHDGDRASHESGFVPATRLMTHEEYQAAFNPDSPQGSVFLDILSAKGVPTGNGLSLIVMNYMDAATMDTQRLRECSMMVTTPSGLSLPFCSYHLTDSRGCRIYPTWLNEKLRETGQGREPLPLVQKYLMKDA